MTKLNLSKFSQKGVKLEHTKFLRYYIQDRLILLSGPYYRTYELPLGQNGNGLKMDKNSKRTEIKQGTEREWHGIARPVFTDNKWELFFDAYHTSLYYRKYITLHQINILV